MTAQVLMDSSFGRQLEVNGMSIQELANIREFLGKADATAAMKGFPLAILLNANLLSNQSDGNFKAVSTFVNKGNTVSVIRTMVTGIGDRLIADVTTSHVLSK